MATSMPNPSTHGPLGVIVMGVGITEVHEEPVTEELRDIAIVALDHVGTHPLILAHHMTPVFRIELAGEHGRVHQVTEQHGELAAFRLRGTTFGSGGTLLGGGKRPPGGLVGCLSPPPRRARRPARPRRAVGR